VLGSLVEECHEFGLSVIGSDATLEASVVRATAARTADGLFGDGVAVFGPTAQAAAATLSGVRIEESARAGLASFGAFVSLASTSIRCAAFELAGEPRRLGSRRARAAVEHEVDAVPRGAQPVERLAGAAVEAASAGRSLGDGERNADRAEARVAGVLERFGPIRLRRPLERREGARLLARGPEGGDVYVERLGYPRLAVTVKHHLNGAHGCLSFLWASRSEVHRLYLFGPS
jgi:hypothetical protein